MPTGEATNGRTATITVGGTTLNCIDDVPLAPAMTAPEKEVQKFQQGDAVNITGDGSYEDTTITCEYDSAAYTAYDTNRTDATAVECTLPGFSGEAIPYISEGPTVTAGGSAVPTMTVTLMWTTTKTPSGGGA